MRLTENSVGQSGLMPPAANRTTNMNVKQSIDRGDKVMDALDQWKRGVGMDLLLNQWDDFLNGVEPGKFFTLAQPKVLRGVINMDAAEETQAVELRNYTCLHTRLSPIPR